MSETEGQSPEKDFSTRQPRTLAHTQGFRYLGGPRLLIREWDVLVATITILISLLIRDLSLSLISY